MLVHQKQRKLYILSDIGDKYFILMLDEARGNSIKEQMTVFLRYINSNGEVMEQFVEVVHVSDTATLFFKISY